MSKNTTLLSVTALKERSVVHFNVDDKLLLPAIKKAQDKYIHPALGSALFDRLIEGIENNDLTTGTVSETTLLNNYIADALIQFVLTELPLSSSFQFFTKGTLRRNTENNDTPNMSDLIDLSNAYKNDAEFYRERLIRYLSLNRETFTLYANDSDNDINPSKSSYTIPCWLPDDDCGCRGIGPDEY